MLASQKIPKREIRIFYKTENMFEPQLKYRVNKDKNEVACLAALVPTFEPRHPQDMEITSEAPISA